MMSLFYVLWLNNKKRKRSRAPTKHRKTTGATPPFPQTWQTQVTIRFESHRVRAKWISPSSSPADQMECRNNRFKCVKSSSTPLGSHKRQDTSLSRPYVWFSAQENGLISGLNPLVSLRVCPSVWCPSRDGMLMYAYVPCLSSWALPRCHINLAKCFLQRNAASQAHRKSAVVLCGGGTKLKSAL